jgi:hypothetical protein
MAVSASLKTPSERATNPVTQSYTALARAVRALDLQGRTRWFYVMVFSALVVALGGAVTGFILLDNSWLQLLIAGALGLIFTQFAFLGHEASPEATIRGHRLHRGVRRPPARTAGLDHPEAGVPLLSAAAA